MGVARRHLIDDQKAAVALAWKAPLMEEARKKQQASQRKAAGPGRGHKKNGGGEFTTTVSSGVKTRHKLAEMAEVSEHKIRQAEQVATHGYRQSLVRLSGRAALSGGVARPAGRNFSTER